ncbi:MAG: SigB/SigF/SigG family RNA polymerase sigma factor [Firmicutes bacterium]|nr:SigB/SigF/SigG family RNA polymerase sigma factor [Bacillota bacterium]
MDARKLIELSQSGDEEARAKLVSENSPLIWSIVHKYRGRAETEDLFQIGVIGLLKAIDKFNLSYDVRFSTYAVPMILGEIKRFLRDDGMIKVARPLKELSARAKRASEAFFNENGREPSLDELAKKLGADPEELLLALGSALDVGSIDAALPSEKDGEGPSLSDRLADSKSDFFDIIMLRDALRSLPPMEKRIILLRYFKDKTQSETAAEVGVSQVQVSRIEKRVLKTLRKKM